MKTRKIAVIILMGSFTMNLMACNNTNSKKNPEVTEKTQSTIENIQSSDGQLDNGIEKTKDSKKTNNKQETAEASKNTSEEKSEQDELKSKTSANKGQDQTTNSNQKESALTYNNDNNGSNSNDSSNNQYIVYSSQQSSDTNTTNGSNTSTSYTTSTSTSNQTVEPEYYPEAKVSKSTSSYINSAGNNVDVLDIYYEYASNVWMKSHSETETINESDGTTSYITTDTVEYYDGYTNTHDKKTSQSIISHVGTPSSDKQPDVGPIEVEKGETFGS